MREIALGFPEAFEKISHGRPVFFAPKMFAMYGGSSKTETRGESSSTPTRSWSRSTSATAGRCEQDTRFFYPAYLGPIGWLGLDFTAKTTIDWDEMGELIDAVEFQMVREARCSCKSRR